MDGAFKYHYAGECSNVCPKGVDPALAVKLLKKSLVLDYLRLLKKKPPCKPMPKSQKERRKEIPDAPAYTVK